MLCLSICQNSSAKPKSKTRAIPTIKVCAGNFHQILPIQSFAVTSQFAQWSPSHGLCFWASLPREHLLAHISSKVTLHHSDRWVPSKFLPKLCIHCLCLFHNDQHLVFFSAAAAQDPYLTRNMSLSESCRTNESIISYCLLNKNEHLFYCLL